MSDPTCRCGGTGVVIGEPRGHDADGSQVFVQWACDCAAQRAAEYVLAKNRWEPGETARLVSVDVGAKQPGGAR